MANVAKIQTRARWGLHHDPDYAWLATAGQSWLTGAAINFTSGLLIEPGQEPTQIIGFADEPFTAPGSFTTAPGTETFPAVGAGVAITRVRRHVSLCGSTNTFTGTLTTDASASPGALAIADIGTNFPLVSVDPTSATLARLNPAGVWILSRVAPAANSSKIAKVIRLIDPIGATTNDTPIPGVNSGQALVEFMIVTVSIGAAATTAGAESAGPLFTI